MRGHVDWKYCLGLELEDEGFDASVLPGFRERLLEGGAERVIFDRLLAPLKELGLVRARGRQRTDSTHVLARIRDLNRLELAGETVRAALEALAAAAPGWLAGVIDASWQRVYGQRIDLVTDVQTTHAAVPDVAMTAPVHDSLQAAGLAPGDHAVDAGYVSADLLVASRRRGITLLGPLLADISPQARAGGYTQEAFTVDWDREQVTCPQGAVSSK